MAGLRNPRWYGSLALSHIGRPAGPLRRVGGGQLMRYSVLGPLTVQGPDGTEIVLPGIGPRVLLAVLLVHANQPVPVATLVEAVWQGNPPRSWTSNIQTYVSRLRQAVPGIDIRHAHRAYRLEVDPAALDLAEFWTDVEAARKYAADGEYPRAVARFRTALGRWRAAPLGNVAIPLLQPELARLAQDRLTVIEDCMDAELAAGRHADIVGELRILVDREPDRDRLTAQLMLALARCGRAEEAVAVYTRARAGGAEPGPESRRLYPAIMRGEVTVPRPVAGRSPFPIGQLPPDLPMLIGRGALVADLLAQLGTGGAAVPLVALDGPPGVGKTALAVHLGHRARGAFPDGQLYADLGGGTRDPLDVLSEWLHALGVTGTAVPAGLDARAGVFRARLADRRVLVVLDDATDAAQIRPLIPGTPGSAVVVTSRSRLTGLVATVTRALAPLRGPESRALLATAVGQARVATERAAADRIATACGHVPLRLRIAVAQARGSLAPVADALDATPDRDAVALGYAALDDPARRALRLLGVIGPAELADWAFTALLDEPDCAAVTGRLVQAHLLDPVGRDAAVPARMRLHELVREYAGARATPDEGGAAVSRLRRCAIAAVECAAAAVPQPMAMPRWQPTEPGSVPAHLCDRITRDPVGWLCAERATLIALALDACRDTGGYPDAARLLDRMVGYLLHRHRVADVARIACAVRNAADAAGDGRTATWATVVLARAQGEAGVPQLRRAAADSARAGYRDLLAWALLGRSAHDHPVGPDSGPDSPLDTARRAAALFRELDDPVGLAQALRAIALALLALGQLREADAAAAEGIDLARAAGDPLPLAHLLSTRATVLLAARDPRRARHPAEEALRLLREAGARVAVCRLLGQLARISATLGERARAQQYLAEARATALVLGEPLQATLLLRDLAASWVGDGYAAEAVPVLRRCARTLVELGQRRRAGVTQRVLATAYDALGDPALAAGAVAEAEAVGGPLDEYAGEQLRQILLLTRSARS